MQNVNFRLDENGIYEVKQIFGCLSELINRIFNKKPKSLKTIDRTLDDAAGSPPGEIPSDSAPSIPSAPSVTAGKEEVSRVAPRSFGPEKHSRWKVSSFDVPVMENKTRFHDFDLPEAVMHAIADLDFQYCTPVQDQLLKSSLSGKDGTAKAQTGTGKTAGFIITILTRIINNPPPSGNRKASPRALILAPTRELVNQIESDFRQLAAYTQVNVLSLFGGLGYKEQQLSLKNGFVDVIAATPGRLIDFMQQKKVFLNKVEILVIDEADRMLDMGFIPDVRKIVYATPHKKQRQTLFFSATLTDEVLRLAGSWTREDAVMIEIEPGHVTARSINQLVYITTEEDKFKNVYNLIKQENLTRVLMFVNRKDTAGRVASKLRWYGVKCGILSGDVPQNKRFQVLEKFRDGTIEVLVATDVAARGIHVDSISHVINYDLPNEPEHYVHRIGRTGRAGATGISVSFADEMSSFYISGIESVLGHKLICEYPPANLGDTLPRPRKKKGPLPRKRSRTYGRSRSSSQKQPAKAKKKA